MARTRARGSRAPSAAFDLPGMRKAIHDFLRASGHEVAGTELEETPDRVARMFRDTFLDGYECDPARVFQEAYSITGAVTAGPVLLEGVPFHGLCPHHLLPYHGLAHLAYVPGKKLASLSSLARLVDCFAHRLSIQETVTRQIAEALAEHLGASGAAVVLETDQLCMTMRSPERKGTRTVTQHFTGAFAKRSDLRLELLTSLRRFGASSAGK
jgi:GTP cyclohydrolase IA